MLRARSTLVHVGVIYEPGDPLPKQPILWNRRERALERGALIAAKLACDPALCDDPTCPLDHPAKPISAELLAHRQTHAGPIPLPAGVEAALTPRTAQPGNRSGEPAGVAPARARAPQTRKQSRPRKRSG